MSWRVPRATGVGRARLRIEQLDMGDLCEVAPVVWHKRLALMKCNRPVSGGTKEDYFLTMEDVQTGRQLARFAQGYGLASTLVHAGTFYVFASRFAADSWNDVTVFKSKDLSHWTQKVAIHQDKEHLFNTAAKLDLVERTLLSLAKTRGWQLEAWAVLANHYHFVARGQPDSTPMGEFLRELHSRSAIDLNDLDVIKGRTVWYNFRETRLTYQKSYLARLNYVHQNAAAHKLMPVAYQYPWCSAAWFERTASPAMVKSIYRFKIDQVHVFDEFEPDGVW